VSAVLCIVSLIAACMCIAFGAVRIGSWLIARRDHAASRAIRDAAFVAQARTELSASNWTAADEAHYQQVRARYYKRCEISATKRGDLRAAADFAELSEVSRG
jgi:hypothetical protein